MTIRPFLRLKHPSISSVETCIGNDTWRRVTGSLISTKSGHMTVTQKNVAKHKLLKPCEANVVFRLQCIIILDQSVQSTHAQGFLWSKSGGNFVQKKGGTGWLRKGKRKGWGGERGYDTSVAIHLRGFGNWSWPKKCRLLVLWCHFRDTHK